MVTSGLYFTVVPDKLFWFDKKSHFFEHDIIVHDKALFLVLLAGAIYLPILMGDLPDWVACEDVNLVQLDRVGDATVVVGLASERRPTIGGGHGDGVHDLRGGVQLQMAPHPAEVGPSADVELASHAAGLLGGL